MGLKDRIMKSTLYNREAKARTILAGEGTGMSSQEEEADWEITPQGLYMATRGFLIRRGYCCANQCRNCPYINWRHQLTWQPIPAERVQHAQVTANALAGAEALLNYHEEQLAQGTPGNINYHQAMIEHYLLLLERWET